MNPDSWRRVREVFDQVVEADPGRRLDLLSQMCAGDETIEREVRRMLASMNETGFLDSPLGDSAEIHRILSGLMSTFEPGQVIANRFHMIRLLGRGGMGEVWQATDEELREPIAIKTLVAHRLSDPDSVDRFKREVQRARQVAHPNVCRVYDLFFHEGMPFLTMELLPGETLAARILREGKIPSDEAIRILRQCAQGLNAAHLTGLVHRDLKPANVMLTDNQRVVVMDFGLARPRRASDSSLPTAAGTPSYMAPEQAAGQETTPAADIYSFAVLACEVLTGLRPSHGGLAALPPEWRRAIRCGLDADPRERPATATALLSLPSSRRLRRYILASVVASGAACIPLSWYWSRRNTSEPTPSSSSVAVLPFTTAGQDGESLGEALSDQIITNLTKYRDLKVIARGSSSQFRLSSASLASIGSSLQVKYLVTGSLRSENGRVRVNAELVDSLSNRQIWSNSFDRPRSAILSVEADVSRALVAQFGLLPLSPTRTTALPAGGEAYLFGRYHLNRRVNGSLQRAVSYLEEATRLSPDFPEAHAALAEALIVLTEVRIEPSFIPRAQAATERALVLDPRLAEAHACLGYLSGAVQHNFAVAERAFLRAIDLNPALVLARQWYSYHLIRLCRFPDAQVQAQKAIELDPLAMPARQNLAAVAYYSRNWPFLVRQCARLLELDPHHPFAHLLLAHAAAFGGRFAEVEREIEIAGREAADSLVFSRMAAEALATAGHPEKVAPHLERLLAPKAGTPPSYVASVFAVTRQIDEAFRWLEKAWDSQDVFLPMLAAYPAFDPLRSDPRYARFIDRLGLNYRP